MEDMSYLNNYIKNLETTLKNNEDSYYFYLRCSEDKELSKGEKLARKIEAGRIAKGNEEKRSLLKWLKELQYYRTIAILADEFKAGDTMTYNEIKSVLDTIQKGVKYDS